MIACFVLGLHALLMFARARTRSALFVRNTNWPRISSATHKKLKATFSVQHVGSYHTLHFVRCTAANAPRLCLPVLAHCRLLRNSGILPYMAPLSTRISFTSASTS